MKPDDILSTKVCSHCKTTKPITDFGEQYAYKDGHYGQCKLCRSKLNSAYAKVHPCKRKKTSTETNRKNALKTKYGLSEDQYAELLSDQGGVCAICKTDAPGGRYGTFHVDHCHKTGIVRGILCHNCNVTLGKMGDSVDGVMKYLDYLSRKRAERNQQTQAA